MEFKLELGDPVEITSLEKFMGYVVKFDEDQVFLCSSERFDPRNVVAIAITDIAKITEFKKINDKPIIPTPSPSPKAKMGQLIQFPGPKGVS